MSFGGDLRRFAERQNARIDLVVRKTLTDVSAAIIRKTPVDTGRARANWQPEIDQIPQGTTEQQDKSGEATVVGVAQATKDAPGRVYYLVNNLPYIRTLEYGEFPGDGQKTAGGFSRQAPQGMVRISIAEFERFLRSQIEQTK